MHKQLLFLVLLSGIFSLLQSGNEKLYFSFDNEEELPYVIEDGKKYVINQLRPIINTHFDYFKFAFADEISAFIQKTHYIKSSIDVRFYIKGLTEFIIKNISQLYEDPHYKDPITSLWDKIRHRLSLEEQVFFFQVHNQLLAEVILAALVIVSHRSDASKHTLREVALELHRQSQGFQHQNTMSDVFKIADFLSNQLSKIVE